ncbi:MAG TPA: amidohydrolase family protein, partial [Nitrolancea sp.]|nr:amidohydrolase family protein [Nitrolancea sp.]
MRAAARMGETMIIDLHSHYFPLDVLRGSPDGPAKILEETADSIRLSFAGSTLSLEWDLFDLERQLAALRRQRLDRRVLAPPPFTILYELPAADGIAWARAVNDGTLQAAQAHPDEFIGFATVPLQDVNASVEEVRRAASIGLQGVTILTNIDGRGLDDPNLDPFWSAVESLGFPILIHPHNVAGADRMGSYYLRNLVGNPVETALAGARLIFGGVLERHPKLNIILSHGGGALPHLIGRLRHGYEVRPEARERAEAPFDALRRL